MDDITRRNFTAGVRSPPGAFCRACRQAPRADAQDDAPKIIGDFQDKIVLSGGVDVVALNGLDIVPIVPDRMLMNHISDPLIRAGKSGVLIPWLATAWRNVDPLTWELTLRQNVRFQNGEPFDGRAVKVFYDAMNDPKNLSPAKSNHTGSSASISSTTTRFALFRASLFRWRRRKYRWRTWSPRLSRQGRL